MSRLRVAPSAALDVWVVVYLGYHLGDSLATALGQAALALEVQQMVSIPINEVLKLLILPLVLAFRSRWLRGIAEAGGVVERLACAALAGFGVMMVLEGLSTLLSILALGLMLWLQSGSLAGAGIPFDSPWLWVVLALQISAGMTLVIGAGRRWPWLIRWFGADPKNRGAMA